MTRKKDPYAGKPSRRRPRPATAVAQGEAARVWRRDMTTQLEILISEADAVSARAIGAALEIRELLVRRPKGLKWHAEAPGREGEVKFADDRRPGAPVENVLENEQGEKP